MVRIFGTNSRMFISSIRETARKNIEKLNELRDGAVHLKDVAHAHGQSPCKFDVIEYVETCAALYVEV